MSRTWPQKLVLLEGGIFSPRQKLQQLRGRLGVWFCVSFCVSFFVSFCVSFCVWFYVSFCVSFCVLILCFILCSILCFWSWLRFLERHLSCNDGHIHTHTGREKRQLCRHANIEAQAHAQIHTSTFLYTHTQAHRHTHTLREKESHIHIHIFTHTQVHIQMPTCTSAPNFAETFLLTTATNPSHSPRTPRGSR